jgi:gliding motility-associated-like protein
VRHYRSKYIALYAVLFFLSAKAVSQDCIKDSNFYSITYHGLDRNRIVFAAPVSDKEVVTLARHSVFSDFVTKYTSQGQVIWSNEYIPDYPLVYWWQYPWYERTVMEGMVTGKDSTCFIYGSTIEHGTTLNGAGPPTHQAGLILHLDKFGNPISGKYLGQWLTDYSVNSLIQLSNGNLVVYLRSNFSPFTSKVICINTAGDIIWGMPLKTNNLYKEVGTANPVMKQLSNGNIMVVNEMLRTLDDTLIYPFTPPIIVPAPLYYFHLFSIDGKNGNLVEQYSYQCPPLMNTNISPEFVPRVKNITELPNGNLSLLADMYLPVDNVIFYKQRVYSRSVANIITTKDGGFIKHFFYRPPNSAAILQNAWATGNNGEQLVLAVDSSNQQPLLFKIGADNQVIWTKSYVNKLSSSNLSGLAIEKQNKKGYFIFQTDPDLIDFHVSVTNAIGENPCTQIPGPAMVATEFPWPWFANKVYFENVPLDIDFRYSNFKFIKKPHPLTQQVDCQYQYTCCTDIIDSLNPHNITMCEKEKYTLPDHTVVNEAGTYYATLKTQRGCDSIVFYNIKVLKSPSHLTASPDTCLNGNSTIQLRAMEGYDTYWWNNRATDKPFYEVHAPGVYTVKVENMCGTKTDTIVVYDHCDFPIYFPTGFTPNGDGVNDLLRVPGLNKNKLRRLSIFSRAGQLVFNTTNLNDGWNGSLKGLPQPSGVYVYYLEMEGLSGKKLNQKGTVVLIR